MKAISENNKLSLITKLGVFSASLLVASSALYIYSPVIGSHADSKEADINLNIAPGIGIRTSAANVNLNATVGSFVHNSVNVDVATNSQYGYTLTLEDKDDSSSMTHVNSSVTDVVTSEFEGAKTSAAMDDNTWGFSLDATDYYFIPTAGNPVALKRTTSAVSGDYDRTAVDFGVKVGMSLTAGDYTDTVTFTAYVNGADNNPEDGTDPSDPGQAGCGTNNTLHDIAYMQEMNTCVCSNTTTPLVSSSTFDWNGTHRGDTSFVPRKKLIDSRDNKTYLVSKLADGNCWMSQNLKFDLVANEPFIASNNDGTTKTVTPNKTTQTTTGISWSQTEDEWNSYSPHSGAAYFPGGGQPGSEPTGPGDEYDWEKNGNYYNWYVATAGTGTLSMGYGEAQSSICPSGWRLPSNYGERSYYNLIQTTYNLQQYVESSYTRSISAPLNFIKSGMYHSWGGTLDIYNGLYWTSNSYRSDTAYIFYLSPASYYINAYNYNTKYFGFAVRCVAI